MQAEFSNSIHSVVVSHYRVCTGKRSHKATPRAWVLEVSGVHTPKHNTTTSSAKNIAEDDSSAWVAVSVVAREETEALSLYDGKNRSCMIFDTTMNDVMSSSSKKRELWSNKVQSGMIGWRYVDMGVGEPGPFQKPPGGGVMVGCICMGVVGIACGSLFVFHRDITTVLLAV